MKHFLHYQFVLQPQPVLSATAGFDLELLEPEN